MESEVIFIVREEHAAFPKREGQMSLIVRPEKQYVNSRRYLGAASTEADRHGFGDVFIKMKANRPWHLAALISS